MEFFNSFLTVENKSQMHSVVHRPATTWLSLIFYYKPIAS